MFVNLPQYNNYVSIPDNFFSIVNINDNDDITIEVDYKINQSDVIQKNALTVRVSAVTKVIQTQNILYGKLSSQSPSNIVKNILNMAANARAAIKNNELSVIASTISDNTKKINNEIVGDVLRKKPLREISSLVKRKLVIKSTDELKNENDPQPVLQVNLKDVVDSPTPIKHLVQSAILRGIDPSHVYETRDQTLTTYESTNGTQRFVAGKRFDDIIDLNASSYFSKVTVPSTIFDTTSTQNMIDNKNILTYSSVVNDQISITTSLKLLSSLLKDSSGQFKQLFIKFELLNNVGIIVQTIQKEIELTKFIDVYNTPIIPPSVNFAKYESSTKANLQIKQNDHAAKSIKIYRKNFSYVTNDNDDYVFVGDYSLEKHAGILTIPVDISSKNSTIYRVVSVGPDAVISSEYTNVVIPPRLVQNRISFVSLTTKIVDNGISVEMRDVPVNIVSVSVLRRNRTLFDREYSVVGDTLQINSNDSNATYVVVDSNVKKEHCYEYVCKLIYKNGLCARSGNSIIEYVPIQSNAIETKIENLQIIYDANVIDVRFSVSSTINESDLDVVKTLLEKQNLIDLFSDEMLNDREKLQKLLAYQVSRTNLTTGQTEDFGILTGGEFSDLRYRNLNNVSELRIDHKYRYEVTSLIRSAETMIETFVKNAIDPTTKKPYTYSPFKFLHPITLTRGNLTTPQTLSSHYPKQQMSFGNVGNTISTDVEFSIDNTYMIDASVEEFTKNVNVIKWKINGSSYKIDHFVIAIEFAGQRKIVGKSHAFFDRKNFHFIHKISHHDIGEVFYVITPVFIDYNVGLEVRTNSVVLGD